MENYIIYFIVFTCTLVPTFFTLWLTERVKNSVKNSFDTKIEILKKEHSKESFKFTKLHEKRLEVLQVSYGYLNQTLRLLHIYVSPYKTPFSFEFRLDDDTIFDIKEQGISKEYQKLHNEFNNYINNNIIYFDEKTEKLLIDYFTELGDIFLISYSTKFLQETQGFNKEKQETLDSMYNRIPTMILPMKKEIERKFRELLGE